MQKYVKLLTNGGFPDIDHHIGKVFPVYRELFNLALIEVPEHDMLLCFDIDRGEAEYVAPPKVSIGVSVGELHTQLEELSQAFKEAQEALEAVLQQPKEPKVGDFVKIKPKEDLKNAAKRFSSRCGYVGKIVEVVGQLGTDKVFSIEFTQASFPDIVSNSYFKTNFYRSEFEVIPEGTEGRRGCYPHVGNLGVKSDLKTLTNIPEERVCMTREFYDEFVKGRI